MSDTHFGEGGEEEEEEYETFLLSEIHCVNPLQWLAMSESCGAHKSGHGSLDCQVTSSSDRHREACT
jgi:hypothetical protein